MIPKMKKDASKRRVKFPEGCVFLAACASGDEDEVEHLIETGADVNTANVDGLTALHQAVIDENLDMVQFLLEQGVDINAQGSSLDYVTPLVKIAPQDNEGWTALHAAVSCGFDDIVRCLLDRGACLDIVNNDGELPIDLVESENLLGMLNQEINKHNIDLVRAKMQEEELMTKDALEWLQSKMIKEKRHPKTGATALHVAASKGYLRVMNILLQAGADVNAKDKDGWTPLHAAAHWGEREACRVLSENRAIFDSRNNSNQTCFDVADDEIRLYLEELKEVFVSKGRRPIDDLVGINAPTIVPRRKNSITRVSTDDKHEKITKKDERKEVFIFKTASYSDVKGTILKLRDTFSQIRRRPVRGRRPGI